MTSDFISFLSMPFVEIRFIHSVLCTMKMYRHINRKIRTISHSSRQNPWHVCRCADRHREEQTIETIRTITIPNQSVLTLSDEHMNYAFVVSVILFSHMIMLAFRLCLVVPSPWIHSTRFDWFHKGTPNNCPLCILNRSSSSFFFRLIFSLTQSHHSFYIYFVIHRSFHLALLWDTSAESAFHICPFYSSFFFSCHCFHPILYRRHSRITHPLATWF